ncbi:MAG: hypothetical protein XD93_0236 [candidate division WS6 bacterium 34_10]|jgi:hypothetical protein|uniref:Uncharacterized protein n=1 Tax=candidate division WS6 bacterium 34_10 TaxID=1641389 RepID=A0A101HJ19_9BACT|nr:MAG: hypothetical protein XD93_0236 [candidate division WS6 bacterium 34_10]
MIDNINVINLRYGVVDFKGPEHFDYMKLFVLRNIEKVLETYNTLISDNVVGNNIEPLDYKF